MGRKDNSTWEVCVLVNRWQWRECSLKDPDLHPPSNTSQVSCNGQKSIHLFATSFILNHPCASSFEATRGQVPQASILNEFQLQWEKDTQKKIVIFLICRKHTDRDVSRRTWESMWGSRIPTKLTEHSSLRRGSQGGADHVDALQPCPLSPPPFAFHCR